MKEPKTYADAINDVLVVLSDFKYVFDKKSLTLDELAIVDDFYNLAIEKVKNLEVIE